MNTNWFHSAQFHGLLVIAATLLAFAISWVIDALHSGTITLSPGLIVYVPLITGLLTLCGVMLRDWLQRQQTPTPSPAPVVPPADLTEPSAPFFY